MEHQQYYCIYYYSRYIYIIYLRLKYYWHKLLPAKVRSDCPSLLSRNRQVCIKHYQKKKEFWKLFSSQIQNLAISMVTSLFRCVLSSKAELLSRYSHAVQKYNIINFLLTSSAWSLHKNITLPSMLDLYC